MNRTGVGSPDLPFRAVELRAGPLASLSPIPHFLDQGAQSYSGGHSIRCASLRLKVCLLFASATCPQRRRVMRSGPESRRVEVLRSDGVRTRVP